MNKPCTNCTIQIAFAHVVQTSRSTRPWTGKHFIGIFEFANNNPTSTNLCKSTKTIGIDVLNSIIKSYGLLILIACHYNPTTLFVWSQWLQQKIVASRRLNEIFKSRSIVSIRKKQMKLTTNWKFQFNSNSTYTHSTKFSIFTITLSVFLKPTHRKAGRCLLFPDICMKRPLYVCILHFEVMWCCILKHLQYLIHWTRWMNQPQWKQDFHRTDDGKSQMSHENYFSTI